MHIQRLVSTFLLSSALVFAQSTPAASSQQQRDPARTEPGAAGQQDKLPAQPTPSPAKKPIPPDAPVITIKGICANPATSETGCETVVTRAQFESLINALNPEMPQETRTRFAENYGRLIVVAAEARKAGVDKLPGTEQLYDFSRMQVLAQQYGKKLQEEAQKIPEAEIDAYYKQHQQEYDSVQLERLIVPRNRSAEKKAATPPPTEAQEKAYAAKIRERWIAGEDPAKLQQEAYKHAGLDTPPPTVDVGERRRNGLPATQQGVFDLKAGAVSEPFVDPAAFFIYKVKTKETKPLAVVHDEIKKTLMGERLQKSMESVTNAATAMLNQSYFEPVNPPAANADRFKTPTANPARPSSTTTPAAKPAPARKTTPATKSKPPAK